MIAKWFNPVLGIVAVALTACGCSSGAEGGKPDAEDENFAAKMSGILEDDEDRDEDSEYFDRMLRELDDIESEFKDDLQQLEGSPDEIGDMDDDVAPARSSDEDFDEKEESNWQKTKALYNAAKDKVKAKKDEWVDSHRDQIDDVKEKGCDLKDKAKKKIGNLLDRAREKLED